MISELVESKITVEETQLLINGETQKIIPLTDIKQLSTDGDIKYIPWFLSMLIPISIFLFAFGYSHNLPSFIVWLLLVASGLLGLHTLLAPPENEFLVINMKQGEPVRTPMNDERNESLEFIRKTNVHIYSLNKKD